MRQFNAITVILSIRTCSVAIISFSEGKLSPAVKEGLRARVTFDAEHGKGALKRRSQQIIDNLN